MGPQDVVLSKRRVAPGVHLGQWLSDIMKEHLVLGSKVGTREAYPGCSDSCVCRIWWWSSRCNEIPLKDFLKEKLHRKTERDRGMSRAGHWQYIILTLSMSGNKLCSIRYH